MANRAWPSRVDLVPPPRLPLRGRDPATLAATFNAVVYGHVLSAAELHTVLGGARTLPQ